MALANGSRPIVPRGRMWKKQRAYIISRDGGICRYSGGEAIGRSANADHVRPLKAGGEDTLWNYVLACEHCNKSKGGKWPADGAPDIVIGSQGIRALYEALKSAAAVAGGLGGAPLIPKAAPAGTETDRRRAVAVALDELIPAMLAKIAIRNPETGEVTDLAVVPDFRDITQLLDLRERLAARLPAPADENKKRRRGLAFEKSGKQ